MDLRPYQSEVIDGLTTEAANGSRRLLLVAPCGSGKTVIASKIISHATGNDQHVLFLAHKRELVHQTVSKLESFGVKCGIVMSGEPWDPTTLVNVASIQTLHSWVVRRKRANAPKADLVVIDEAHHLNSSKTWQDIVNMYPEAIVLGMTATPVNRRGKGLGYFFDAMTECPNIPALIEMGYLVKPRYYAPSIPDLKGLKVIAGDYSEKELEPRMDVPRLIGDICENWAKNCPDRQTLVFATGIKHSVHIVESFKALGVSAAHVDGGTPGEERDRIVREFGNGNIRVLSNCNVFTEGTDIPSASCLIFARPTKSLLLYLQVAGRIMRTFPGKNDAIILDHSGNVYEHGPVNQEWIWKLDYAKGDVSKSMKAAKKVKKEITCGNCKAVYYGKLECPECHWKPTIKGKDVATYAGYLQALDEIDRPKENEEVWYRQLLGYAIAYGKKPGLAYFKFLDKFGHKPPWAWRNLEPMEPGTEVKSWIRSQNIRFAKSRRNPANNDVASGPYNSSKSPTNAPGSTQVPQKQGSVNMAVFGKPDDLMLGEDHFI